MENHNFAILIEAIKSNTSIKLIEMILELKMDINNQTIPYGNSALHIATIYNRLEICELLIKNGININMQNNYGDTALHYTAVFGHIDICKLLIDAGADINIKNILDDTVIFYARTAKNMEMLDLLVDAKIKKEKECQNEK